MSDVIVSATADFYITRLAAERRQSLATAESRGLMRKCPMSRGAAAESFAANGGRNSRRGVRSKSQQAIKCRFEKMRFPGGALQTNVSIWANEDQAAVASSVTLREGLGCGQCFDSEHP